MIGLAFRGPVLVISIWVIFGSCRAELEMLEGRRGEKNQKNWETQREREAGSCTAGGGWNVRCSSLSFVLVARERRRTEQKTNLIIIIIVIERKEIIEKETRTSENYRREIQVVSRMLLKKKKRGESAIIYGTFFPSALLLN